MIQAASNYLPKDRFPAISVLHQRRVNHLPEVPLVLPSGEIQALLHALSQELLSLTDTCKLQALLHAHTQELRFTDTCKLQALLHAHTQELLSLTDTCSKHCCTQAPHRLIPLAVAQLISVMVSLHPSAAVLDFILYANC